MEVLPQKRYQDDNLVDLVDVESPVAKKAKDASEMSPPVTGGSDTPASGAQTTKTKKAKNPIFAQLFDDKGQSKVTEESSAKKAPAKPTPAKSPTKAPAKAASSKSPSKSATKKKDVKAIALAELKQEVTRLGGDEKVVKGWKIQVDDSASSAKGAGGQIRFVSPDGKKFSSHKAVLTHLGVGLMSRTEAHNEAVKHLHKCKMPFKVQGGITVKDLGCLLVEKGPEEPLFHTSNSLMPIGYKSEWMDSTTGLVYECEVLDGQDVLDDPRPAYQVMVRLSSDRTEAVVTTSLLETWKGVREFQMENGSEVERDAAEAWGDKMEGRFGLSHKEVRKRLEGLPGASTCFKYKFLNEGAAVGATATAGKVQSTLSFGAAEHKGKKQKTGETKKGKQPEPAVEQEESDVKKSSGSRPVSAYKLYANKVRSEFKSRFPEVADKPMQLMKHIQEAFRNLPEAERAEWEKKAADKAHANGLNGAEADGSAEQGSAEQEEAKPIEEDNTVWRTEGSELIGVVVRRYIYDARHQLADAGDGVVAGWLPTEEADYLAEETGEPAPLYHIVYEDTAIGVEDLEEHEVREAMALMKEELPPKVQAKYDKRKLKVAARLAKEEEKRKEREAKAAARQHGKELRQLERGLKSRERELDRDERTSELARIHELLSSKKEEDRDKAAMQLLDESDVLIASGEHAGLLARTVPRPTPSVTAFPPPELTADFLRVYTFVHDLSGPMGCSRMSFADLVACFVPSTPKADDAKKGDEKMELDDTRSETESRHSTGDDEPSRALRARPGSEDAEDEEAAKKERSEHGSGEEAFCQAACWLASLACRAQWIREEEEALDEPRDPDVGDVQLAAGPILSSRPNEGEPVKFNCWQLLNDSSWPEMVRTLLRRCGWSAEHRQLQTALGEVEPTALAVPMRLALLRFLSDMACSCDKVQRVINEKLKQVDRILEKKRVEDLALKRKPQGNKRKADALDTAAEGPSDTARSAPARGGAEDSAGGVKTGEDGKGEVPEGFVLKGGTSRTALEVMTLLIALESQPFEIRYKGDKFWGTLEDGVPPKIMCNGEAFDTPAGWIKQVTDKTRVSAKAIILYKGKTLRDQEKALLPPPAGGELQPELDLVDEEGAMTVDTERRKREIQAALRKAEKGLRYTPAGADRWHRQYWCFDGVLDRVWVEEGRQEGRIGGPSHGDYGFDGRVTEEFIRLNETPSDKMECFCVEDGSLRKLYKFLSEGPQGRREKALLQALQAHGLKGGFDGSSEDAPPKPEGGSTDQKGADGGEKEEGGAEQSAEKPAEKEAEKEAEGYEWNELPNVGDLVWAKRGEEHRQTWYPVKVVEPPTEDPGTESDEDEELAEEDNDEWLTTGSAYIGKRVHIEVEIDRRNKEKVLGRIIGWLPVDKADYVSDVTGKPAALWRAKPDKKKFRSQDLEEYEVKEAVISLARSEARRRAEQAEYLSARSMFGQSVKWVYGQLFDERERVECFALGDLLPYQDFKDQRVQELRRATKTRVLTHVERANAYYEEHGTLQEKEEGLRAVMQELGWSRRADQQLSEELKAACRHCSRWPRVLNVVQKLRDALPSVCTVRELRVQTRALLEKLLTCAAHLPDLEDRLQKCSEKCKAAATVYDVGEMLRELEGALDAAANQAQERSSVDLSEWRTEGHEWIGKRLRREFAGQFGRKSHVNARIVGWLPAEESDYKDVEGRPAPLWHMVWAGGEEEEDLEEEEVREGMRLLLASGDSPDSSGLSGIWAAQADRQHWLALAAAATTTGALALALYLLGDRALPVVAELSRGARLASEEWDDYCFVCTDGGNLVCCDRCPRTVHVQCVGLDRVPKGDFLCLYCERELAKKSKHKAKAPDEPAKGGERTSRSNKEEGSKKAKGSKSNAKPQSREQLDKLRKELIRYGAFNGAICEVQPDQRAVRREERWFVRVVNGNVLDKPSGDPKLTEVQFLTAWRRDSKRMQEDTDSKLVPLSISAILGIGSDKEMLKGDARKGFLPADP